MGNQSVRSSDFNWGASDSAGDAGLSLGHKSRHKNVEPGTRKRTCKRSRAVKNTPNRSTKSTRCEFRRLQALFGDKIPVVLAFLADSHYQVHFDENNSVKHCCSEQNNTKKPCDQACRRFKSYPCASYCPKCKKKSASLRLKQKH